MKESNDTKTVRRRNSGAEPLLSEFVKRDGVTTRLHNVLHDYIERWGDVKTGEVEQKKFLLLRGCGPVTWHAFELARDNHG